MIFAQLLCIQLMLLLIVSRQVPALPMNVESSDAILSDHRDFRPYHTFVYGHLDEALPDDGTYENLRQHFIPHLSKRRAKANLAGLWGVPTKFA